MAVRNTVALYIDGKNMTRYMVTPYKWANFLDEQLDEAVISLRRCPKRDIKPLTPVEIRITNEIYFGHKSTNTERVTASDSITKYFIVADQPDSNESPVGSGRYDHNISIIELTKLLERIVVESITYTNDLGKSYTQNAIPVNANIVYSGLRGNLDTTTNDNVQVYKTPSLPNNFKLYSYSEVHEITPQSTTTGAGETGYALVFSAWIYEAANYVTRTTFNANLENPSGTPIQRITGTQSTINLSPSTYYVIEYTITEYYVDSSTGTRTYWGGYCDTFTFVTVENYLPLKKWTVTDVINRLFAVAEPLRMNDTPRFVLNSTQAALFDNIIAPQFSFTKQTLRECLKQIGGFIHGEPRLTVVQNGTTWSYEVSYDMFGGAEISGIATRPYLKESVSQAIDSFCTNIDSSAENLVNALSESVGSLFTDKSGTITEPYAGGFKTVRCDTMYSRIAEDNMLIQTVLPIYAIKKLECGIIPNGTTPGNYFNITDYVFESSVYNSRLSSYSGSYPYSKAYALMYTQGSRNITALNFKEPNPVNPIFENYAIVNILREVTGDPNLTIPNYALLAFRVTYTPFYSARVSQTKPYFKDTPRESTIIYNQQSNVIESRYYGENIKGVVARLGNVEKSKTYRLSRLSQIPKAGQKYNDDYYISAVSVEMYKSAINCTIGLSKDFNRLSQYIGISSVKRYSEVSQTQAQERSVLYREYIVIGDMETVDTDTFILDYFTRAVAATFIPGGNFAPITKVYAYGKSGQGAALNSVALPVIASAFGNSISFTWAYEDNYSAGATAQYASGNNTSGYFQNNYSYTDYYGRLYYYNFSLAQSGATAANLEQQTTIGTALPGGVAVQAAVGIAIATDSLNPYVVRKDNREALKFNVQVDFVTNRKGMIIGSALAANNPLVGGLSNLQPARIYAFTEPLDKFIDHITGAMNIPFTTTTVNGYTVQVPDLPSDELTVGGSTNRVYINTLSKKFPGNDGVSYKAWAIITPMILQSEQVEDEQGNITTQTVQYGGDVLLAENMDFDGGFGFNAIYFTTKHDIYNKAAWVTAQ